jgi:hypothetical protein
MFLDGLAPQMAGCGHRSPAGDTDDCRWARFIAMFNRDLFFKNPISPETR